MFWSYDRWQVQEKAPACAWDCEFALAFLWNWSWRTEFEDFESGIDGDWFDKVGLGYRKLQKILAMT